MADDAKLLAVIEANTKQFENALKRIEGQTDRTFARANRSVSRLDNSFKASAASAAKFGRSLGIAFSGAAAIALAARTIRTFIDNTIESENAVARLNAVLASTRGVAGLTADQLQELAKRLQGVSVFGDEAIIGAENILLTFDKIGKDIFPDALQAVLNMSSALGTDLNLSAKLVGRALQDPVKALGALRKAGVDFSPAQETIIKHLAKTGELAKADTLILDRLRTKYGDAAKAARDTLGGALIALTEAWGDLFEISDSDELRLAIEDLITAVSDPKVKEAAAAIGVELVGALKALADILPQVSNPLATFRQDVANFVADVNKAIVATQDWVAALPGAGAIKDLGEGLGFSDAVKNRVQQTTDVIATEAENLRLLAALQKKLTIAPGTPAATGGAGVPGFDPDALKELADAEAALAAQIEAEEEAQRELEQARKRAAAELVRQKKAVVDLISDLEFENRLIGMTNEQREVEIALRRAGEVATGDQQRAIAGLVLSGLAEQKALDGLIDRMDEIRNAAGGALSAFNDALRNGQGLAGGLKSALESVLDTVIRIAEQRAIESLFGAFGTAGGGGGIGAIIGGLFGGARASSASAAPVRFAAPAIATAGGMRAARTAGGQAPAVVHLMIDENQMFASRVVGISGAVAVQAVRSNNKGISGMIASQRARGLA